MSSGCEAVGTDSSAVRHALLLHQLSTPDAGCLALILCAARGWRACCPLPDLACAVRCCHRRSCLQAHTAACLCDARMPGRWLPVSTVSRTAMLPGFAQQFIGMAAAACLLSISLPLSQACSPGCKHIPGRALQVWGLLDISLQLGQARGLVCDLSLAQAVGLRHGGLLRGVALPLCQARLADLLQRMHQLPCNAAHASWGRCSSFATAGPTGQRW